MTFTGLIIRFGVMAEKRPENDLTEDREAALNQLQARLGYYFINREHLLTALRHRSFVHQWKDHQDQGPGEDNQRLEFLGDAVLSMCISVLLYQYFLELKEGDLSKIRAGLVNEGQLADISRDIGLPPCLFLGRGEASSGGRKKNSILADALEAVLAAVYLDQGFDAAMKTVERLWKGLLVRASRDDLLKDFKTRLQEETQRILGETPVYQLTASHGPDHARTFEVALFLGEKELTTGRGRSKKEAEQEAARAALIILKEEERSSS